MVSFDRPVPVTMVVTQAVQPGVSTRFEQWLHGIAAVAGDFPGHLGVHVIRPPPGSTEYTTIFRFDTAVHLRKWLDSDERRQRLHEAEQLFAGPGDAQEVEGIEAWFSLPRKPGVPPPARYKMALLTFVAVSTLLLLLQRFVVPLLGALPALLRTLIVSAIIVTLLTYVVLPRLTRVLSGWLSAR